MGGWGGEQGDGPFFILKSVPEGGRESGGRFFNVSAKTVKAFIDVIDADVYNSLGTVTT